MASVQLCYPSLRTARFRWTPRLVQCASERQALFGRIAPVYDNLNDVLSLGQHRIWKRMAVAWSRTKRGDCVLDVCCGSGDLAFLLSEKVGSDGKVTGLDFSKEQLKIAASRQHSLFKSFDNIEWLEGDAMNLPFPDDSFDAISMGYGLRNVMDKQKAMKEMLRVLKYGSKVSILDFNKSTQPLISSLQEWMISNIVVPVASGYCLTQEYQYLAKSIKEFLTGKELENLALEAGFSTAVHYEISGGLMDLLKTIPQKMEKLVTEVTIMGKLSEYSVVLVLLFCLPVTVSSFNDFRPFGGAVENINKSHQKLKEKKMKQSRLWLGSEFKKAL